MTGKTYNETVGQFASITVFIGFNVTFFVQLIMGSLGSPRLYYHYWDQFQIYHQISTVGVFILAIGLFTALINLIKVLREGRATAPANPWGAKTLVGRRIPPPPLYNFTETPVVTHGPYAFETEKA